MTEKRVEHIARHYLATVTGLALLLLSSGVMAAGWVEGDIGVTVEIGGDSTVIVGFDEDCSLTAYGNDCDDCLDENDDWITTEADGIIYTWSGPGTASDETFEVDTSASGTFTITVTANDDPTTMADDSSSDTASVTVVVVEVVSLDFNYDVACITDDDHDNTITKSDCVIVTNPPGYESDDIVDCPDVDPGEGTNTITAECGYSCASDDVPGASCDAQFTYSVIGLGDDAESSLNCTTTGGGYSQTCFSPCSQGTGSYIHKFPLP